MIDIDMSARNTPELVEQVLSRLPDDVTMEDVQYSLYVAEVLRARADRLDEAVDMGTERSLQSGLLLSHQDVVMRMARWLQK
jgi:hypothetical protein